MKPKYDRAIRHRGVRANQAYHALKAAGKDYRSKEITMSIDDTNDAANKAVSHITPPEILTAGDAHDETEDRAGFLAAWRRDHYAIPIGGDTIRVAMQHDADIKATQDQFEASLAAIRNEPGRDFRGNGKLFRPLVCWLIFAAVLASGYFAWYCFIARGGTH